MPVNLSRGTAARLQFGNPLLPASYSVTISKSGGGTIDNQTINELLGTFTLDQNIIDVDLLSGTTVTVTDANGANDSADAGTLADANLLGSSASVSPDLYEGNSSGNTFSGVAGDDRIYGYAGNDTLSGDVDNDLIRGGAGNDTLNGGTGNDLLIDGNGSDMINGGEGNDYIVIKGTGFTAIDGGSDAGGGDIDILALDDGISLNTSTMAGKINNIERVDMSHDSAANTLTLTADTVRAMTDAGNELQIVGDNNDTLNVNGFAETGTVTIIDGIIFNQYQSTSGSLANLLVDEDIVVNVV